jgi:hypothetical protein
MLATTSQNIQASVRPHEKCEDTYYANEENNEVQAFPTLVDNRFTTTLNALSAGSTSTVIYNPTQGVSDVVLRLQLPTLVGDQPLGLGVGKGWGYAAIKQIGFRYAGSSMYFITGHQNLIEVLSDCEDDRKKNAMLELAGKSRLAPADWAASAEDMTAYVVIKLPHTTTSALEKTLPFPSDCLTAPIQIQIQLAPYSDFIANNGGSYPSLPYALGEMTFRQVSMQDNGNLISRRVDLASQALPVPLRSFVHSQFSTTLAAGSRQINVTGFRQGQVKKLKLWTIPVSRQAAATCNPLYWDAPKDIKFTINGLVYADMKQASFQLWNLLDRKTTTSFNVDVLTWNAGTEQYDLTNGGASSYWVEIPLGQEEQSLSFEYRQNSGLAIANSVCNLELAVAADSQLEASFLYNCTFICSGGTGDYVF